MAIVSDTNILCSLAAADSLGLIQRILPDDPICIAPAVERELHAGLARGKAHIERVIYAIQSSTIQTLTLSEAEQALALNLPLSLHEGERESIALCKMRRYLLLCNDHQAVRYCQRSAIDVINLEAFLRLAWLAGVVTQDEVRTLIETMETVEHLRLSPAQYSRIFAPRPPS